MSNRNDFVNSLKNLTVQDLENKILDDEMRLKKLKFAHTVSPLENPMSIRDLRKDLARAKTELQKRKLGVQTENN
ncbi:MAG TPA: 50S ribosomal protein L29 [Ginsengibacter sp.]|nr:50S ribosomal protein L29 [Chitinophagaceae bacterium]MCZ2396979.1 50S ribosomal protein L29 [Chitinophagales bacterium]HRN72954.1 50S ribosomal protein L29 [Ginsengibacter sp.]MCO5285148.1 50S ribosomal protein L29 [Chitinophagaceae bacterium]MCW5913188.1 50S ribosomal protein L29 [Chitinophagaceae bacterium]